VRDLQGRGVGGDMSDPTKGYTPEERHHVEMLRKRREKLEREDALKARKEANKK
jgi:hypothetical protein